MFLEVKVRRNDLNIHIIPNEKFTEKFVQLISNEFDIGDNRIYIYNNSDSHYLKVDSSTSNVIITNSLAKDVDLSVLQDGKLFVHGFYNHEVLKFLYRNLNKISEKQMVLIMWGGDLYGAVYLLRDRKPHLYTRYYEFMKRKIMHKCRMYMTFAAPDFMLAQKWYHAKGVQFDCLYPSNTDISLLDSIRSPGMKHDKANVLLGNSATDTNQHLPMLNILSKYKDYNINIYCPLSYGDKEYGAKVEAYGKNLFGEKFIPVKDYKTPDEYAKFLNGMDIAVFNNNRQQGTGNIEILAYLGKKVYVRSDTTTWGHYVVRDKCAFYDSIKIEKMSFEEFTNNPIESININKEYFNKIWDISYVKSLWQKVMDYR